MIAIKDPKCKQMSINRFWLTKEQYFETKTKCAAELTGKNSKTPCIADKIRISIEESIYNDYCIADMQNKSLIYWIF